MASESKGNFIMISPHEIMGNGTYPIAVFNISGINEEDRKEYYPIMSNFYDTALCLGNGNTLMDINHNPVPPQVLQYRRVNKIMYNGLIYWLSNVNDGKLKYRTIENNMNYITISTTDDWNTYTITVTNSTM